ncbi:FAD binding domain-containing protein [Dactylosporangium sp. CA-092794]|uniref:FAD binding domain-containing protein n=1 Tax=Dactylosporangium sp. CA-092794 TaxID=3239929 RepID=UPI003D9425D9
MTRFAYARPADAADAVALVSADPDAAYLAGGTTELDLAVKDGVIAPTRLVDISRLPLHEISLIGTATTPILRIGATATMERLAAHPAVAARLPLVRLALLAGASVQLRNMATIGGNLLQRTRCRYFRDAAEPACNKRTPGSGCGAVAGPARMHAILGASPACIAAHGSDLAVALTALDALVHVRGTDGPREVPLSELYLLPGPAPDRETVLRHGELITAVDVPVPLEGTRSTYLKVRDRASYEFALASAAVAVVVRGGVITDARLALGGVATVPWRARGAEELLRGERPGDEAFRAAAEAAVRDPFTVPGTEFKVELARRTLVRALRMTTGELS